MARSACLDVSDRATLVSKPAGAEKPRPIAPKFLGKTMRRGRWVLLFEFSPAPGGSPANGALIPRRGCQAAHDRRTRSTASYLANEDGPVPGRCSQRRLRLRLLPGHRPRTRQRVPVCLRWREVRPVRARVRPSYIDRSSVAYKLHTESWHSLRIPCFSKGKIDRSSRSRAPWPWPGRAGRPRPAGKRMDEARLPAAPAFHLQFQRIFRAKRRLKPPNRRTRSRRAAARRRDGPVAQRVVEFRVIR